jgi:multidrug resistance efflux pump
VFEGQSLGRIVNTGLEAAKEKSIEELEKSKARLADLESQLIAARLESSRASADAARVRAELEAASREFDRQKVLFREGAGARKAYDRVAAAFEKLAEENKRLESVVRGADTRAAAVQIYVEEARTKVTDDTEELEQSDAELLTGDIKSPASGLLVNHKKNSGDTVTRDVADLFEIAIDLTELEAVVDLPAALAKQVTAGANALVQIAEAGPAPLEAKVREVKEGQVFVEFLSPSPAIRPGMTAQVRFLVN